MHKDSANILEQTVNKNFDFFNTKVISPPKPLNKSTRIILAVSLGVLNLIMTPYLIQAGKYTGDMIGDRINQSIHRDLTSLK